MDPKILMGLDAEVPLANGDVDRRLRDGVGAEVVQLHSIVLAQSPHEPADGDAEASLVEANEADDVALRGLWLGLVWVRGNPRRRPRVGVPRQQPVGDQLRQNRHGGGGLPPRQRLLDVRHLYESRGDAGVKAPKWLRCSLPLSFSFFFLLFALGYGFRMQRRRRRRSGMKANGQVSPNNPPSLRFYSPRRADFPPRPKSTALNAVEFAVADGWAPRPRSLPRAHAAITVAR